ncbi:aminotransferase class IV [Kitasatospora sp. NBC_01250]|uniref:aminotransferase class IV n=1 Tax=Kitasatospora sp. NBC_01250 TaxID=2903571 RepID=UPI002E3391C8|nr:aminotransferase class IV [Kitasatospora sp. NBC_01250]
MTGPTTPTGPTAPAAERWLAWEPERGLVTRPDLGAPGLLAADSWLVEDGRVRALELHQERFTAACLELGLQRRAVDRFWAAVTAELPRVGVWFPRVELRVGGRLGLRLRPAPPRTHSVKVFPWTPGDPRTVPHRKGPDLALLADLRAGAQARGADDALLSTESGELIESATASLLWWSQGALCRPAAHGQLSSVTARLIARQAESLGIAVHRRPAKLAELADCEAWLVNALHGIRPVTHWVGTEYQAGQAERALRWRRLLSGLTQALPTTRQVSAPTDGGHP